VIIGDFDFVGITILPPETDPVLLIDADAVLSGTISSQGLQPVSGWHGKLHEVTDPVQLRQLPVDHLPQGARTPSPSPATVDAVEQVLRPGVRE
jgi:hypothetical protein